MSNSEKASTPQTRWKHNEYISMIHFDDKDFEVATASTPEEVKQLGMAGWVKYDEIPLNGTQMHFYKKPKRFSNL